MTGIFGGLIRWLVVVVIGLATFWPGWGALWLAIAWLPLYPVPVTLLCLVWAIVLALVLPLTLRMFRWITTGAVALICGGAIYLASTMNQNILTSWPWFMWAVLIAFFAFGWWKIATPLWRWANGIVAVSQTPEHHSN